MCGLPIFLWVPGRAGPPLPLTLLVLSTSLGPTTGQKQGKPSFPCSHPLLLPQARGPYPLLPGDPVHAFFIALTILFFFFFSRITLFFI